MHSSPSQSFSRLALQFSMTSLIAQKLLKYKFPLPLSILRFRKSQGFLSQAPPAPLFQPKDSSQSKIHITFFKSCHHLLVLKEDKDIKRLKRRWKWLIVNVEAMMSGMVKIKLLGVFRRAYGSNEISLKIENNVQLREIIQRLAASSKEFKHILIDPELESPLPNAVILLNGRDISALNGLETPITHGDEIVLIPVIHGG
ncbi:TPA: MoaD/ThiS family protein [Candidatus Bathyarchaeota archaeon]|nr:MoaD/ThiS family protein [Candidatus Bathyarchaeota archaeon]